MESEITPVAVPLDYLDDETSLSLEIENLKTKLADSQAKLADLEKRANLTVQAIAGQRDQALNSLATMQVELSILKEGK